MQFNLRQQGFNGLLKPVGEVLVFIEKKDIS